LREAPVHLAVFCDDATPKGAGLGAATMPEARAYSVVGAITLFWLMARAEGLGVGWVSILDPARLCADLDVPPGWAFIGYLCVGWPVADHDTPELERAGWEARAQHLWMEHR
jgi:5,6-dimethylbenzimidazole synthase